MKVFQNKDFQPVNVTIESQDELNWLLACLNCSTNNARSQWRNMGKQGFLGLQSQAYLTNAAIGNCLSLLVKKSNKMLPIPQKMLYNKCVQNNSMMYKTTKLESVK